MKRDTVAYITLLNFVIYGGAAYIGGWLGIGTIIAAEIGTWCGIIQNSKFIDNNTKTGDEE